MHRHNLYGQSFNNHLMYIMEVHVVMKERREFRE